MLHSVLLFVANVVALTLDIASSGGNKSSPLLYGLLYEVSKRARYIFLYNSMKVLIIVGHISFWRWRSLQ